MKIAIYGSRRQHENLAQFRAFLKSSADNGCELIVHTKLFRHIHEEMPDAFDGVDCREVERLGSLRPDFAVSIGGDGTFLRTAAWVGDREIPILGVNTGHLGFLSALDSGDLPLLPLALKNASELFRIERRSLIAVDSPSLRNMSSIWPYALNEVALLKEESASMIIASTRLGDDLLAQYYADGLIVSTPTGSTAYNLSIGGPLVQPDLDVHIIAPVAAHSLSMRPLVVGGSQPVNIIPEGRASHFRLAIDGRSLIINNGEQVTLTRAPFCIHVLQAKNRSFTDTLRKKLHWGEE